MRVPLGSILAGTLVLAGCLHPTAGGGGGPATPTAQAAKAPTHQVDTKATVDQLTQASENADRAVTGVVKRDWKAANNAIQDARSRIHQALQKAPAHLAADLKDLDRLASKAQHEIQQQSAAASKDTIALVNRLNQVAIRNAPVEAGGGKPPSAPVSR